MIPQDELKEIARFAHLKLHQQEKHYIQTIALNSIYSSFLNELVFKGGTALFLFYGLNRFSEDLDFTMVNRIDKNKIIENIKKDLENLGIKCRISRIEDSLVSLSFRIDVEGPLFTKEIERCYIRIEISKREKVEKVEIKELRSLYPEILNFNVNVMAKEEILAEKVRALITRNQARDLFDLNLLFKKGVKPNFEIINKKLEYYKKRFTKKEFIKSVNEKKDIWRAELEPLVIGELPEFKHVKKMVLQAMKINGAL